MLIRLTGSESNANKLLENVVQSLEHLGLLATVEVEIFDDEAYKESLNITQDPALCIEESSIDFKDMIFEWVIPETWELNTMFLSIFWAPEGSGTSCGPGGCDTCETGCASIRDLGI